MSMTVVSMSRLTHIHVTRTSRDCDGRYDHDSILVPGAHETFRELWTYCALRHVDVTWNRNVEVERGTRDDGLPFVEYVADTDEGFVHEYAHGCDDENCDPSFRRFRDHTAEAAGY